MQQAGPRVAGPQGWELSLPCLCPNALSGFPAVAPGAEKSSWWAGGLAGSWGGQPQTPQIPCYSRNTPALEMPRWDGTSAGVGGHPQLPPTRKPWAQKGISAVPGLCIPPGRLGGAALPCSGNGRQGFGRREKGLCQRKSIPREK